MQLRIDDNSVLKALGDVCELAGKNGGEAHVVGGAVRDVLLGREVGDRDWVVVGSSVEEMLALGFTQVGRDFPVFLHPDTGEEYALARTERKQGAGHTGFAVHADPDVTLERSSAARSAELDRWFRWWEKMKSPNWEQILILWRNRFKTC